MTALNESAEAKRIIAKKYWVLCQKVLIEYVLINGVKSAIQCQKPIE
jgi:hypothetical protein